MQNFKNKNPGPSDLPTRSTTPSLSLAHIPIFPTVRPTKQNSCPDLCGAIQCTEGGIGQILILAEGGNGGGHGTTRGF